MGAQLLRTPAALLLDRHLPASAKLVWMVSRLHQRPFPPTPALLEKSTGLARATVRRGLGMLAAVGWYELGQGAALPPGGHGPTTDPRVPVPVGLLTDARLGAQPRVLYGVLHLTSDSGQFTYAGLSALTHTSINTIKGAIRDLVQCGWLTITQANQLAPIRFAYGNPILARSEAELIAIRQRLEEAPYRGEAIMREYLNRLVDSRDFEDDAAPGFLVNPWTDQRMELDRFYPPDVAFEFNGPQHYGPTGRFSQRDADMQMGRDYMKLGICMTKGIKLQVIHAEDLSLEVMKQKVGELLPLRNLTGQEPVISFLESASARYRAAAQRGRR